MMKIHHNDGTQCNLIKYNWDAFDDEENDTEREREKSRKSAVFICYRTSIEMHWNIIEKFIEFGASSLIKML